ncbi:beta-glucosidase [Sorangium sp. So ce1153]|uniref:beta-glucosidase family protein n=1 Tax=Sorangium sp. So ce1153 TaxID=3133333 RepID=UPI003F5EEA3F
MNPSYFRSATALACGAIITTAACTPSDDAQDEVHQSEPEATKEPPNQDATDDPDVIANQLATLRADLFDVAGRRAAALVARLTTDEKIALVHGTGVPRMGWGTFPPEALNGAGYIPGIPRLGIPQVTSADSACGVNIDGTRATPLPAPIALAASWDTELAEEYGERIAIELRTLGYTQALGGGINLAREPRSGRTFEYMGEDPVLSGEMIASRTIGTQSQKVLATVKHYAMNGQETNRAASDSQVDERTMRETELLAFEIAVKRGKPASVMCSYNKVNGTYACENPYLLTDVLKKEWGFKGVVQSDWAATHSTAPAALAGLDEEQPSVPEGVAVPPGFGPFFSTALRAAVDGGEVSMSRLNDMVQRKLRALIDVGIFDAPPTPSGAIDEEAGQALALAVAQRSSVLLKNATVPGTAQKALPLTAEDLSSVVVVGGHADVGVLSGGGSGAVPSPDGNAVSGCEEPAPEPGTLPIPRCATWYKSAPLAAIQAKARLATVTYFDGTDAEAAANAAENADVAIVFATQWETEALDLPTLSLPDPTTDPVNQSYDQDVLIETVASKAKRTIVVLETGSPVTMPWLDHVHAVLEAWYPGVRGGQAIADLLFGDVNPSGKLPITFPRRDEDLPQPTISSSDPIVRYTEGLLIGYRWYDAKAVEPLFPFGHGLSYTTFGYSDMVATADLKGNVTVSFTVTNEGPVAGAETAQVYATLPTGLGEPPQRLVDWKKVWLAPGESRMLSFVVPAQRLATWNVTTHAWKVNAGRYRFMAASSSRDPHALTKSVMFLRARR